MIGLKDSRHSPNQSDAKLESIKTWSPAFSRAVGSFVVLLEFSLALTSFFSFLLIGRCCYICFMFYDTESKSTLILHLIG